VADREVTGDPDSLRSTVAHEVFHCHQEYFVSSESPQWVIEGRPSGSARCSPVGHPRRRATGTTG
jgi:hypothetical protein